MNGGVYFLELLHEGFNSIDANANMTHSLVTRIEEETF